MKHPSHSEPETSILLTHSVIKWFCNHYLNGPRHRQLAGLAGARENAAGLPPAYVLTPAPTPARRRRRICRAVKEAGVSVTYKHFPANSMASHHGQIAEPGQHRRQRHCRLAEGVELI